MIKEHAANTYREIRIKKHIKQLINKNTMLSSRFCDACDQLFKISNSFFSVYAQQWDCWIIRQFYFQFFKESPHCSP